MARDHLGSWRIHIFLTCNLRRDAIFGCCFTSRIRYRRSSRSFLLRRQGSVREVHGIRGGHTSRSRLGTAGVVQALRGVRGPRQRAAAGAELALLRWDDICSRMPLGLCFEHARAVRLLLPKPGCCSRQCRAVAIRGCSVRTAAAGGFHRGA